MSESGDTEASIVTSWLNGMDWRSGSNNSNRNGAENSRKGPTPTSRRPFQAADTACPGGGVLCSVSSSGPVAMLELTVMGPLDAGTTAARYSTEPPGRER